MSFTVEDPPLRVKNNGTVPLFFLTKCGRCAPNYPQYSIFKDSSNTWLRGLAGHTVCSYLGR